MLRKLIAYTIEDLAEPVHAATVIGDTLGDPLKDTAGPSLHVVVKLLNTITLAVAPLYLLALLH